ncbi:MAG: hypothetical protein BGO69_05660 [Bacteroidetes bacterium 46-16]|nr:MAG: hypothetical protein BGO69_05660 [Bacteroidetes bacterium 46-16]
MAYRIFIIAALSCLAFIQAGAQVTFPPGTSLCDTGAWQMIWHDEFDGPALDTSKWYTWTPSWNPETNRQDTFARTAYTRSGGGVLYLDSNVQVSEGTCKLTARYQPTQWITENDNGGRDTVRKDHISGLIHTWNRSFGPGRFEIRCRLPEAKKDVHATFWTWGDANHNEIDIFEWYGKKHKNTSVVHAWPKEGERHDGSIYRFNAAGWHTYTCDWDQNFIRVYIDGALKYTARRYRGKYRDDCRPKEGKTFELNPAWLDDRETSQLIVSLDADRKKKIPPGETRVMEIDYIRVYQRINNK